jgi:hypothetical protein
VSDDIEVHFDPARGDLTLNCGAEAFDRIRRTVCAEAGLSEVAGHPPESVRYIEVVSSPVVPEARGLWQAALWLGCVAVAAALVFVFGVGVVAVVKWLAVP